MSFWLKLRHLRPGRRRRTEAEMREELQTVEALAAADGERVPEQSLVAAAERSREVFTWLWLEQFLADARFALRSWRRRPGLAVVLILMLGLGIGATTSVFGLAYTELWQPYPYPHPESLVSIEMRVGPVGFGANLAAYAALRQAPGIASTGMALTGSATLTQPGAAERVQLARITPSFLPTLGIEPQIGRGFLPDEAVAGRDGEAMLSNALWHSRFGGSRTVLGQAIELDGRRYTVIGVLPRRFDYGIAADADGVCVPAVFTAAEQAQATVGGTAAARLAPGVNWEEERPRLAAYSKAVGFTFMGKPAVLTGNDFATEHGRSPARGALLALLAAVGMLLSIACANVAGLLLARSAERQHEMAVRRALGAGRGRIARQLLTEGALLGAAGATVGLGLVNLTNGWLRVSPLQRDMNNLDQLRLSPAVWWFALGVSMLCALLFSAAPMLQLPGRERTPGGSVRASARQGVRGAFLVAEVGLSFALLIGAGLAARSLIRLTGVQTGYDATHLAAVEFQLAPAQVKTPADIQQLGIRALAAVEGLPGLRSAAVADTPPLDDGFARMFSLGSGGRVLVAAEHVIGPNYFATLHQSLRLGRDFDERDSAAAPGAVIVNEAWVRRYAPHAAPLGLVLHWLKPVANATVVGVVADARDIVPDEPPTPEIYLPWAQAAKADLTLVANAAKPDLAAEEMRAALTKAVPNAPIGEAEPLSYWFQDDIALPRFQGTILMVFAGLALGFALSGIWALVAYGVRQQQREIGIRMTLGAAPGQILGGALRQVMWLTGCGVAGGLVLAWFGSRLLASLLFEMPPTDPAMFATVTVIFAVVALLAAWLPARRALRVDPAVTLRCE